MRQNHITNIGIIGALFEEVQPLLEQIINWKEYNRKTGIFYYKVYEKLGLILTFSGPGKVNAAISTQVLIDHFKAEKIILSGTAGALEPAIRIGDVVIGTELIYHDLGYIYGQEDFLPSGCYIRGNTPDTPMDLSKIQSFPSNESLVKLAQLAGHKLQRDSTSHKGLNFAILSGPIVTGDQAILSSAKREWLKKTFKAKMVEMEGAAVAHTAHINKVPFLVIKAASDNSDERTVENLEVLRQLASSNSIQVARKNRPLSDNFLLAANNAATLVKAIIDQLLP